MPANEFSPYGAFRVTADGAEGLSRHHASSSRFVAPSRGVRYAADTLDPAHAERDAVLLGSREGAVLAGPTAADHWGLPLPPWIGLTDDQPTVVAVPAGSAHPNRRGVRGRRFRLPPEHLTTHRGLAVTTPARTWVDCAADIPLVHLIAMGDAILHRGLARDRELRSVVTWAYRRRGVANARRALPVLDGRSESPGESLTRAHLVLDGIRPPRCNEDIYVDGRWVARVDMCWPEEKVIVEYDGAVHLQDKQRRRDARRRNELLADGWLVFTVTGDDLRNPRRLRAEVARALAARTPR